MARKKGERRVTKSDFLRKALGRKPDLELREINRRWAKAGHPGEISAALYYQVRRELGIRTVWTRGPAGEATPVGGTPGGAVGQISQFKITLLEAPRPIWRRIQVEDGPLDLLHEHIQTAMGWTNSHLHHFRVDDTLYGDPRLMQENFGDMSYRDSTTTFVSDILPADGGRFRFEYEYDFGDGWMHEVLFEGHPPADPKARYPLCLEGEGACPPEDVGGVWGYGDFLEALADPDDERHGEVREWVGGEFDPEAFDPSAASRAMRRGLPAW